MNFFIEFTLIPSILVILITILEISILKDMFKTKNFKYVILLKIAEIIYFLAIINLLFFEISRFEIFFGICFHAFSFLLMILVIKKII